MSNELNNKRVPYNQQRAIGGCKIEYRGLYDIDRDILSQKVRMDVKKQDKQRHALHIIVRA